MTPLLDADQGVAPAEPHHCLVPGGWYVLIGVRHRKRKREWHEGCDLETALEIIARWCPMK